MQAAAAERGLATAVFADPHDEAAFASIVGDAVTRLIAAGRTILATQQDADKVGAALGVGCGFDFSARRHGPRRSPLCPNIDAASSLHADDGPHRRV